MIPNSINNIKRNRAEFARDVAYVREMAISDQDDNIFEMVSSKFEPEVADYSDLPRLDRYISESAVEDEMYDHDDEIGRIINATSDLSFDEMIGIDE